jgi:hypothetical protein
MKSNGKKVATKVLKHIKEDSHEFREQLKDDKKLAKQLKKVIKKKKK